jgi:hypothetical protein
MSEPGATTNPWDRTRTPGGSSQGSAALSLCSTGDPLYTRFAKRVGASISETTMRPNPRLVTGLRRGHSGGVLPARLRQPDWRRH